MSPSQRVFYWFMASGMFGMFVLAIILVLS